VGGGVAAVAVGKGSLYISGKCLKVGIKDPLGTPLTARILLSAACSFVLTSQANILNYLFSCYVICM
jgi:hypothetical protein